MASCALVLLFMAAYCGGLVWLACFGLAKIGEKKREAARRREAADREFKERDPEAWERRKRLEREDLRRQQLAASARIGWKILLMCLRK